MTKCKNNDYINTMSLPKHNSPRPDIEFDAYGEFIEQGGLFIPDIPSDEIDLIGMWRAQNVGHIVINLMLNRFVLNPFYEAHVTDDRDYAEALARTEVNASRPYVIPEDEQTVSQLERYMAIRSAAEEYNKGMMLAGVKAQGYEYLPQSTQGEARGRTYPKGLLTIDSLDSASREFIKQFLPSVAHRM